MGRIWRVRLYPERKSRLYVLAIVFEHRKDLIAFWRECQCHGIGRARVQEVHRWTCNKTSKLRRDPKVACASFWVKELGNGVVTHELFHATIFWGIRRKLDFTELDSNKKHYSQGNLARDGTHERLAYANGELNRQFVSWAYKKNLYNRPGYSTRTTADFG